MQYTLDSNEISHLLQHLLFHNIAIAAHKIFHLIKNYYNLVCCTSLNFRFIGQLLMFDWMFWFQHQKLLLLTLEKDISLIALWLYHGIFFWTFFKLFQSTVFLYNSILGAAIHLHKRGNFYFGWSQLTIDFVEYLHT